MSTSPIADYGLLSDRHSAALVSRDGSVDWLCFPRFDSPSIFARLLDDDAGHWSIRPSEPYEASRRYRTGRWCWRPRSVPVPASWSLTDALLVGPGRRRPPAGRRCPTRAGPRALVYARLGARRVRVPTRVRSTARSRRCSRRGGRGDRAGRRRVAGLTTPVALRSTEWRTRRHRLLGRRDRPVRVCTGPRSRRFRPGSGDRTSSLSGWTARSPPGGPGPPCTRRTTVPGGTSSTTAAACCRRCRSSPAARSSPLPRPRSRGGRRRAQLGLPVHLGPRREPHHGRALGGRLPRRGQRLLRLPHHRGAVTGQGPDAADHVRRRRRARPVRAGPAAPARLARQPPRTGRQRRLEAASRSTSTASSSTPPSGSPTSCPTIDDDTRRFLVTCADPAAERWRGEGPGHLGGTRRTAALPALQGDVLGRPRRGRPARRPRSRRPIGWPGGSRPARRSARRCSREGWSDGAGRVHAVLRVRRPRRLEPRDADRRVPPRRRPTDARHDRRHREPAHRQPRAGLPLPTPGAASTGSPATRGRSSCARSGWPRRLPCPDRSTRARAVFERARLVRQRRRPARRGGRRGAPASCWATSRRRSATSGWSTPPWAISEAERARDLRRAASA